MTRFALTQETFQAFVRLKHDLIVVGAAASESGNADDRAVIGSILRNAAAGALHAFNAEGVQRDAAWEHLIVLVDELLWHRLQLPDSGDCVELKRLEAFVSENRDVLERPARLPIAHSVAV